MKPILPTFLLLSLSLPAVPPSDSIRPTHADVAYGPHERNVLDFWQAEGDRPRPLLVFIHGGGWTKGDKSDRFAGAPDKRDLLAKGVSVASINYRLTPAAPLPAPVHDAARAIQFLRWRARDWNIDGERICLVGGSAGACTSMWLLCHDDLADKDSDDPVLRESTRVAGAAALSGQTSIDPKQIREWLGPRVLKHRMIHMAVGEPSMGAALENYDALQELYAEFSPYHHASEDDPPLFMRYGGDMTLPAKNADHGIHHPVFGVKMKEKANILGMECHLQIGDGTVSKSPTHDSAESFLLSILLSQD
jgi:acetyl esterase/lipase